MLLLTACCVALLQVVTATLHFVEVENPSNQTRFCQDLIFNGFGDEEKKTACPYSMHLKWRKLSRLRVTICSPSAEKFIGAVCQSRYGKRQVGFFKKLRSKYVKIASCDGLLNTAYYYNESQPLVNWTTEWWHEGNPFFLTEDAHIICTVMQKPGGMYWKFKELIPAVPEELQTSTTAHVYKILHGVYCTPESNSDYDFDIPPELPKYVYEDEWFCKNQMWKNYSDPDEYSINPYVVSPTWISPTHIRITIQPKPDEMSASIAAYVFLGFICQVHYFGFPLGNFEPRPELRLVNCSPGTQNTAILHNFTNDYTNYTLNWHAPLHHRYQIFLTVVISIIQVPLLYFRMNITVPLAPRDMVQHLPPLSMSDQFFDISKIPDGTPPQFYPLLDDTVQEV